MQAMVTVGEHSNLVSGDFTTVLVEEVMARSGINTETFERIVEPTDPAYMIYTSGTTGKSAYLCFFIMCTFVWLT